ncbi:MAG: hypothetical protein KDK27_20280, partial [Leptospiraceae bacterium]|nr:hypothetical protein [Leptospiraceae bacterium]
MPSPLKLHLIILPLVLLSARCGLAEQEAIQAQNAPESEDSVNRTEQSGEIGQHNDALPRIFWINCINSV